ncbi:hypothetical protein ABOONEI_2929 [Aciduliprofundum boonei T469]|nr:hypothetical protein ABOONEI_5 [Aciduliprofundum boonei T469]EDY34907.1 hypothetical protein ABOONEI_1173 [Aciduliprofundum boonei T469]EDY35968.1 hypothetical protein ABOONEI_2929 [Aciduliprofundum boonei T469]
MKILRSFLLLLTRHFILVELAYLAINNKYFIRELHRIALNC